MSGTAGQAMDVAARNAAHDRLVHARESGTLEEIDAAEAEYLAAGEAVLRTLDAHWDLFEVCMPYIERGSDTGRAIRDAMTDQDRDHFDRDLGACGRLVSCSRRLGCNRVAVGRRGRKPKTGPTTKSQVTPRIGGAT